MAEVVNGVVERNTASDIEKIRIAALRTHLYVAANTKEMFSERLSQLRNAYLILAAGREQLEAPEFRSLTVQYNNVRLVLDRSLHPGRQFVPPEIRA